MGSRDTSLSRIYVGNLPPHVSAKELENEFRKYGTIVQCDVKKTVSGSAFAFIEFEDARDAADAIKEKDGCDFEGNRLRVEVPFNARENGRYYSRGGRMMGRGQKPRRGKYVVEVSGLPISGSWQDLKDHLREAGECGHADVFKDGTGEVSFFNRADMLEAIEKFDGSTFRSHEGEKAKISIREKEGGWRYDDDRRGRYDRNRSYSARRSPRSRRRSYSGSISRSRSYSSRSRSRSYSSRDRSRSISYSRSGSRSLSDSKSRSSSSRSRSMDRRRDAYDKKRNYSRSLSHKDKKRVDRCTSKGRSISKSRSGSLSASRSLSRSNSRSSSLSQDRKP